MALLRHRHLRLLGLLRCTRFSRNTAADILYSVRGIFSCLWGLCRGSYRSFWRLWSCLLCPFRLKRPADHSGDLAPKLVRHLQGAESRHSSWRVEVPCVLGKPDEVPDFWIGSPRATKRRTRHLRGHAGGQIGADISLRGDRIERRQLADIEGQ